MLEAADQFGVPLPGAALIFQLYRTLEAKGLSGDGNHGLMKALENGAGVEVGGSYSGTKGIAMTTSHDHKQGLLPAGQPAPAFKLTAVKSGRQVSQKDCTGDALGRFFTVARHQMRLSTSSRRCAPLTQIYPRRTSAIDLSSIPRLLHLMVKPVFEQVRRASGARYPRKPNPDYIATDMGWQGNSNYSGRQAL